MRPSPASLRDSDASQANTATAMHKMKAVKAYTENQNRNAGLLPKLYGSNSGGAIDFPTGRAWMPKRVEIS